MKYKSQDLAKNSELNEEIVAQTHIYKKLQSELANAEEYALGLEETKSKIDTLLENAKADVNLLKQQKQRAANTIEAEKQAKAKACRIINAHDLHYDFNHPAYIENDKTLNLEDQEVYIDTWVDALDRCKQLTQ
tara:strand:- start:19194 stop:19595 length:402 start_codon:yes stop_codon:yes gene_type:complete